LKNLQFFFGILLSCVGLLIILWLGLIYQLGSPSVLCQWAGDIVRYKKAVANKITQPKILLVGGSSVLFNLRASLFEEKLGIPTVNLGVHAAMGLRYMLDLATKLAQKGDTVILSIEYSLYDYRWWNDNNDTESHVIYNQLYLDYALSQERELFFGMPWHDQVHLVMAMDMKRIWGGIRKRGKEMSKIKHSVYDVSYLNRAGDQTGHLPELRPADKVEKKPLSMLNLGISKQARGWKDLDKFIEWAKSNDIKVFTILPVTSDLTSYDRKKVNNTFEQLRLFYQNRGVRVLGADVAVLHPEHDFFDTAFHLHENASIRYTNELLRSGFN
jgi:hypothetical protein